MGLAIAAYASAAMVGWAASATPSVSPSATGGMSRSCVHKFAFFESVSSHSKGYRSVVPCCIPFRFAASLHNRCAENPVRLEILS